MFYHVDTMSNKNDTEIIRKYIRACAKARMTLPQMADAVGRTKGWASLIINGKITRLQFGTRNRILEYLGEL